MSQGIVIGLERIKKKCFTFTLNIKLEENKFVY